MGSGKNTTTGRLILVLSGLPGRGWENLKAEAVRLGKGLSPLAFHMDRQKEEREVFITIACTTKEFYTKWHYSIIDAPGHRDFAIVFNPVLLSMVWQLVDWAVWPLDCCTDGCTFRLEWALVMCGFL